MVTESMMYWITRLDGINFAFGLATFITIVASIITHVVVLGDTYTKEETAEAWHTYKKTRWLSYLSIITCVLGLVFVPTTKEMAMIYAVPAITRSDFVREDLPELYDYGIDALKEQLKEWSQPETKGE